MTGKTVHHSKYMRYMYIYTHHQAIYNVSIVPYNQEYIKTVKPGQESSKLCLSTAVVLYIKSHYCERPIYMALAPCSYNIELIVYRRDLVAKIWLLSIYSTKLHHTETLALRLKCFDLKEKLLKQHFVKTLHYSPLSTASLPYPKSGLFFVNTTNNHWIRLCYNLSAWITLCHMSPMLVFVPIKYVFKNI